MTNGFRGHLLASEVLAVIVQQRLLLHLFGELDEDDDDDLNADEEA